MKKDYKKMVLQAIGKQEVSQSGIAFIINRSYPFTTHLLQQMKEEGLIEEIKFKKFTYWRKK